MAEDVPWLMSGAEVARFPASSEAAARTLLTAHFTIIFVGYLNRSAALDTERKLPGFQAAFANYDAALWRWVDELTPPELPALLDNPKALVERTEDTAVPPRSIGDVQVIDLRPLVLHRRPLRDHFVLRANYLLSRALYVGGLKAGLGFEPAHAQGYLPAILPIADTIGDKALFDKVRQHRHGGTPKLGHATNRLLKYDLIDSWLAGRLWHMASRAQQIAALKIYHPDHPAISSDALLIAQRRLGLRWPAM
ncbi:MAG: hypothetical protein ACLQM8_18110 [Limisphaerales bacterium]